MNMLLLSLLFPAFGYLFMRGTERFRDSELERNITMIRQSLAVRSSSLVRSTALSAREAVAGFDFTFLQNLVAEVTRDDPEIVYFMILDKQQTVIAHNDINMIGSHLTRAVDNRAGALMSREFPATLPDKVIPVQFFWPEASEAEGRAAIMEAVFPVYSGNTLWGIIRCGYSLADLNRQISLTRAEWAAQLHQVKLYSVYLLGVFLLIGFVIASALTRSFVQATRALHAGVHRVAAGDLDHETALHGLVCDEFAGLASSFNIMTQKLRLNRQQLDDYSKSLEEKVVARTRELQEAQEIMLKQAHEAGMAEMAVGVLHNIGNAITPAQVGVTVLVNRLQSNPLRTRLADTLVPLHQYLEGKWELSALEKTRLAELMQHLPAGISEEFDRAIGDLQAVSAKHSHIENIINLQMRYARLLGAPHQIDVNSLVRDALKILGDSLAKREVALVTDLHEVPPVEAEEPKLLQVFVNLIKNGYEAMDNNREKPRELSISTFLTEGEAPYVYVVVKDTGCGFTEEEKSRFFSFGYSTKERGSGFGLHSCANYLIANHGSIEALSGGHGMGAEFIVRLPASRMPDAADAPGTEIAPQQESAFRNQGTECQV
ncbi:MAG: HAMP domain-containing protein [Deltaproteobacteria bacterium]|nr:HAMP domain-containing protein [Deltaproteobacteria bacterium]